MLNVTKYRAVQRPLSSSTSSLPTNTNLSTITVPSTPVRSLTPSLTSSSGGLAIISKLTNQLREIDPRTVQVYEHLHTQTKDNEPLTNEEKINLCSKLSRLEKKDSKTVHELICYHHSKHGGTKVVRNRAFPYKDMKEQGRDVAVFVDQLPDDLLLLLARYVQLLSDDTPEDD